MCATTSVRGGKKEPRKIRDGSIFSFKKQDKKKNRTVPNFLLFVCVENSCRSQMAEGFAKKWGAGRFQIFSAGSRPSGEVHSDAVAVMKERGIDLTTQTSKGLDELPKITWDAIVTMGCGDACPHLPARKRLDWDLPDPKGKCLEEMRHIRDEIERRVQALLVT